MLSEVRRLDGAVAALLGLFIHVNNLRNIAGHLRERDTTPLLLYLTGGRSLLFRTIQTNLLAKLRFVAPLLLTYETYE